MLSDAALFAVDKVLHEISKKEFRSIFSQDKAQAKKQSEGLLNVSQTAFLCSNAVLRKKTKKFKKGAFDEIFVSTRRQEHGQGRLT